MSEAVMTPVFRVSYPNVFRPKLNEMSKKEEYTLVALFKPGEDLTVLKKAVEDASIKKWGADPKKWPKKIRPPFRDQGEREKELEDGRVVMPDGYTKGAVMITLKCYQEPGLIDQKRAKIIDESQFYAGCYARATVSAFAYDTAGNCGVSFWLNNVQKAADGEPFSGRRKAEDEFAAIETPEDSGTAGSTDDIFGS